MNIVSKWIIVSTSTLVCSAALAATTITGAGSSFIYPVMAKWTQNYYKATGNQVNYQPIGSGGGLRQLGQKVIDFAASDKPLSPSDLKQKNWKQFPAIVGAIVPIVHIEGIQANQLTLSGPVLASIYLGQIKYWDNAQIKKLNPKLTLPHQMITAIHRADGSGTTFNFTYYLSQTSSDWKKSVGYNTVVRWNSPTAIGAKGNAGVAQQVQTFPGAIGYVEYAYAKQSGLTTASMINQAGQRVEPSMAAFTSAAEHAKWSKANDYYQLLANPTGKDSWPIDATTYILIPKASAKYKDIKHFFQWVFANGAADATALDYIAIPKATYKTIF